MKRFTRSSITDSPVAFEQLKMLLEQNRSIRRFDHDRRIAVTELREIVGIARLCASGRNAQPMKYRIVSDEEECSKVFPLLAWAGYYHDWKGPDPEEQPVAYIVQCLDTEITENPLCDDGLQLEAITLGAAAKGIGCCIIKAFNSPALSDLLELPGNLHPRYVVALGYRAEIAKIVDLPANGDYKYFRNEEDEQCVPKRPLSELLIQSVD